MSLGARLHGMEISAKLYNSVTALVANFKALRIPAAAAIYRTYVAGELTGPNQNNRPRSKSADAEIKLGLKTILARCRYQVQNNPYIAGEIRRIVNNAVRRGNSTAVPVPGCRL